MSYPKREDVYAALWSLVLAGPTDPFVTKSRFWRHFDDISEVQCPALFQREDRETWVRPGRGIPPKRTWHVKLELITRIADLQNDLASPIINDMLDYLDDTFGTDHAPQNVQTLGGLVEHVYIEGEIVIGEGIAQEASITYIPITILVP